MDQWPKYKSQEFLALAKKLLKENIGINPHDLGFGKGFVVMKPKTWATKEKKISKLFHQFFFNCASKDTIKEVKG